MSQFQCWDYQCTHKPISKERWALELNYAKGGKGIALNLDVMVVKCLLGVSPDYRVDLQADA